VTVPVDVRQQLGLHEGDEVEFAVDGNSARIVRAEPNDSLGRRLAARLRGRGSSGMSTDQIMELWRGDD
jgi:bifunctional DNA-binding transcriptional regulator/antitoxin component of YhaV-PrlF toxin-antitoxin module